jgi:predicted dehydrogenase
VRAAAAAPMTAFGWGLIGPGGIARRFADALRQLPDARLVAVHGRDQARAARFAEDWREPGQAAAVAHADLEQLLADPAVRAVYIATPHAFHANAIRRCLLAGKPVLCEKPLVVNAALARELTALAQARGVFLMEALWTRFLPIYEVVGHWLATGAIGAIRGLQSSFCFHPRFDPSSRLFDPAQAGGSLLDLGIYNLAMTQWVLQQAWRRRPVLEALSASAVIGASGVDLRVAAALRFGDGVVSQFQCGLDGQADNALRVFGERGVITVPEHFWEATAASLHVDGGPTETVQRPFRINGFEGQVEEAMRCIAHGEVESPVMPHADSVVLAGWMDRIRADIGLVYPFE